MSIHPGLTNLAGQWSGTNRLWLYQADPYESATGLTAAILAQGQFLQLQYNWSFEGAPQDGLLLLGYEEQSKASNAVWVDSFHMQDKFMLLRGMVDDDGKVVIKGAYAVPPGLDWGWQISLALESGDQLELVMHNITPEGETQLAVKATYSRQP